ncbi:MAG: hypothetical protein M0Q22_02660 [Sulfuritalea sp.]|jgi:hypothetical protein|nr:hypothetical protein [Sulfuritalea sp.]
MSRTARIYFGLLSVLVLGWVLLRAQTVVEFGCGTHWLNLLGVTAVYLLSHGVRMLRLALLTLDRRDKIFPLIAAHALTAFPSSFLPFKIGEILRLAAFLHVFDHRRKALAVWLAERFGDVATISVFIVGLYLFNVSVPAAMRMVFVIFLVTSALALAGLFAVAKIFVYLNRHLVLVSHTAHGLALLKASHALRGLELDIYTSVRGRLAGFLWLSVLVWCLEIIALSLFINRLSGGELDFAGHFLSGLLGSLPGGAWDATDMFGLYQSLALVVLTAVFAAAAWLAARIKTGRQ